MRLGVVLAALLAVASLALHLALPFAIIETSDGQETLSRGEAAQHGAGSVPGASFGYLLAGTIVLAVGGVALVVGLLPGPAGRWSFFGGAIAAGLGAAMTLHGNALWAGRGVSSWIHGLTGATTPAPEHAAWNEAAGDLVVSITPISSLALLGTAIAVLGLLAWAWPQALQDQRGIRSMAARHARVALIGAGAILACGLLPWVVQTLAVEGSEAHYAWSAYDILQKREAGLELAQGTGEAGVVPWNGLAVVIQAAFVVGIIAVMAPWLGVAGRHLESMGQSVFGRLLENVSLATIPAYGYFIVAGFLGAFTMQDPTSFQAARTTGLPLVVSAVGLAGLIVAGLMARRVLAVDGDVVADDFPEPVVYD